MQEQRATLAARDQSGALVAGGSNRPSAARRIGTRWWNALKTARRTMKTTKVRLSRRLRESASRRSGRRRVHLQALFRRRAIAKGVTAAPAVLIEEMSSQSKCNLEFEQKREAILDTKATTLLSTMQLSVGVTLVLGTSIFVTNRKEFMALGTNFYAIGFLFSVVMVVSAYFASTAGIAVLRGKQPGRPFGAEHLLDPTLIALAESEAKDEEKVIRYKRGVLQKVLEFTGDLRAKNETSELRVSTGKVFLFLFYSAIMAAGSLIIR